MPSYQLPSPMMVATAMLNIVLDLDLIQQIGLSLFHIIASIFIAFCVGTFFSLLPLYNAHFEFFIDHRLTPFLNSFSGVGWLFIAILWFGINSFTVIFAVTMVLIPFAIINLRTGILEMDTEILELGKSLTRTSKKLLVKFKSSNAISLCLCNSENKLWSKLESCFDSRIIWRRWRNGIHPQQI